MIWLRKNRAPETPWLLQSSARRLVQSGGCKYIVGGYTLPELGSLKGIGTPGWLSQYTDRSFSNRFLERNREGFD